MTKTSQSNTASNRLAREKSPYLLQHAQNPVDWFPWGPEAFEKARRENKPILLSIGYSTCHWCHVMEVESFENSEVGDYMNRHFVNIKVDREERPDVDSVYMTAVQAMTGSGGWPLNVFLTPDLKPFYGGTYFPPKAAHGRPSWRQLLEQINKIWSEKPDELRKSADQLTDAIRKYTVIDSDAAALDPSILEKCEKHFASEFDPVDGGFGGAPKFPRPSVFLFLTRRFAKTGNPGTLKMVTHTLRKMARGGIYDQLGGGFARYSVDAEWIVPHFEKMLYDNAQLVAALVEAWQLTGDDFFAGVARETLGYVTRDMTHEQGGFYSAEDADSEGVEGRFYIWSKEEIDQVLGGENAPVFNEFFGVTGPGNFEDPHHPGSRGNILHQASSLPEIAEKYKTPEKEAASILDAASRKLFEVRNRRVRPHLDDKILTSWNGLMISAFARASTAFRDPTLAEPAIRAARFIESNLVDAQTGLLRHRWREGEADANGFHADYAFLIQGLLDLYEACHDPHWLLWAIDLAGKEAGLFYDPKDGGFFMTPAGKDDLLVRIKDDNDNAEPSGNSVAVLNLIRLARLTGREDFAQRADKTLELFSQRLRNVPFAVPLMASAYAWSAEPPIQIVVAAEGTSPEAGRLLEKIQRPFIPFKSVLVLDEASRPALEKLHPFLKSVRMVDGRPTAYVCENFACKLPVTDPEKLDPLLQPFLPAPAP